MRVLPSLKTGASIMAESEGKVEVYRSNVEEREDVGEQGLVQQQRGWNQSEKGGKS
jgi:hypothetical protein